MSSTHQFCDRCGAVNRLQARFCISCGELLQGVTVSKAVISSLTGMLDPDSLLGQRYRVVKLIGQGGMGAVYKAEDLRFAGALRAVKELSQSGLDTQQLKEATESFEREALILAQLNHPNLPRIYDHFSENARWYLVMDYVEGETLETRLAQRPDSKCTLAETMQIALQLCTVLHYLHTRPQPIIFRDLKPSNIMLVSGDYIYLIDFGIARFFKAGQSHDTVALGSPGYAAPEQYGRYQTTPSSDIYSLGATLYRMLSGYDPASDPFQFPELTLPGVPGGDEVAALVMQMVEMRRDRRPSSALDVRQRLQDIVQRYQIAVAAQAVSAAAPVQAAVASSSVPRPTAVPVVSQPVKPTVALPITGNTIVVDQAGAGNYYSVREALEHARANMRILVRPGYYHEQLVLDKPVEIIGEGPVEQIILAYTDASCLLMQTDTALVRGLTIRGREQQTRQFSTIDIAVGRLLLKACDISSDAQVCIHVHNAEAEPLIQQCKIHDCRGDALYFSAGAQGMVEDCALYNNKGSALVITDRANPLIKLCKAYQGASNGLYIYDHGKGRIEECSFSAFSWSALAIEEGGDPTVWRCALHDGRGSGLYVAKGGRGTITECEMYRNAQAGVVIVEHGNPLIQQCKIYDGQQSGVYIHSQGKGTLEDCEIFENTDSGVMIGKGGLPQISTCWLHDNRKYGVVATIEAGGSIENCRLQNNWKGAWDLQPGNDVQRQRNSE